MNSSNVWISLFIEHCLSSYETGRRDPASNWEDDGSNIRFSASVQQHALINTWHERNDLPMANLTDSDTQIDAFLSRESLREYIREFPARKLSKNGCRGYFIHLADFELVYEYSMGSPTVHLYVKRFSIIWERDKIKAPPMGKSAWKKPALGTLIKRVFSSIKARNRRGQETPNSTAESHGHGDIPTTQAIHDNTTHPERLHLMTQIPPCPPVNGFNHDPKHDAASPGKLLERVAQKGFPEDRQSSQERSMDAHSLHPLPEPESRHRSVSRASTSGNESRRSHGPRKKIPAAENDGTPPDEGFNSQLPGSHPNEERLSQDSAREDTIRTNARPQAPEKAVERSDSPFSPDKQLRAQIEASQNVTLRPANLEKPASPNTDNPWEGMTEIRSIDVTVPKDQMELLESDKKPWYPPPVGEQMVSGHVPPALLEEWNSLVFRRNQRANNMSKPVNDDHPTTPSTPAAETTSDSTSDSCLAPGWDETPGRTPRRGAILPVDSSPIKGNPVPPQKSREKTPNNSNGHTEVTDSKSQEVEENIPVPQADQDPRPSTTPRAPVAENNEPTTEGIAPDMVHDDDDGHESDGSSSDSEMSVSVPQPLSGSTQLGISSQAERGVSSTGPSLPDSTRQNIQVVETPAAVLNKARPAVSDQDGLGTGHGNVDLQSQVDKFSSQSRVPNTYVSHDGDSKGEISQESSRSLPPTGPDTRNPVLLMGTPFSNEAPLTQPTPWSGSNSAWASSGPRVVEGSVAAASTYQSQSSKAFSSYRDLPPSSMLSVEDEHKSPSTQSSARGTSLKLYRGSPLKRFASELGDSERGSPSKRSKLDRKPTAFELEPGLDERIISRRQSYIIKSAQSVEAARVYEKFRNDYPSYAGDFEHFTKQCSRLQAFRESGGLQRSFLWDDFIIKHLEVYPPYLAECYDNETKYLNYDEWFGSTVSRPTYKKRSLTVLGISACAAQFITIDESRASSALTDMKTSFTENLRDRFNNFHAHSFAETPQGTLPLDGQSEDGDNDTDYEWNSSQYSIPDSEPARVAAQKGVMNSDRTTLDAPKIDTIQEGSDEDMEDFDINTAHETASVELGHEDEAPTEHIVPAIPTVETPSSDADIDSEDEVEAEAEDEDEAEDAEPVNENWFLSLRHIYPPNPVWSDDPNTPFKKWARADQDVLSVRNRRGGGNVLVDEKGVIQRISRG